jgi:hypothetical protein
MKSSTARCVYVSRDVSDDDWGVINSVKGLLTLFEFETCFSPTLSSKILTIFLSKTTQLTTEPLIPIGCLVTAYYLTSGIRSFYQRDAARSQKMMRARVGAQFATLLIFIGYAGSSNIDWTLAPMYQQARKLQKEKQEKEEASAEQNSGSS